MAAGGGMYPVAITATILTVGVLEMMHFVNLHYTEKLVDITLKPEKAVDLPKLPERLKDYKMKIDNYSIANGKVHLSLRLRQKDYLSTIQKIMNLLEGFTIEEMN